MSLGVQEDDKNDIAANVGPLAIMADGTLQTIIATTNSGSVDRVGGGPDSPCASGAAQCTTEISHHELLQTLTLQPDGFPELATRDTYDIDLNNCALNCVDPGIFNRFIPTGTIPDGQGGMISTWTKQQSDQKPFQTQMMKHLPAGLSEVGPSIDLGIFLVPSRVPQTGRALVLGQNNQAFMAGDHTISAINPANGAQVATFQTAVGKGVQLLAATSDGGLLAATLASDTDPEDTIESLATFDANLSGSFTPAGGGLTTVSYYDPDSLIGVSAAGQGQLLPSLGKYVASSPWTLPQGVSRQRGAIFFTKEITVVGWVDKDAISVPDVTLVNPDLIVALDDHCVGTLVDYRLGARDFIRSDVDRQYANAFLLRNSNNNPPPQQLNSSYLAAADFRAFNRLQSAFLSLNNQILGPQYFSVSEALGNSVDSCHSILTPAFALRSQAHPDNGAKGVTGSKLKVFHLNEGRVGLDGQEINFTVNYCTQLTLDGFGNCHGDVSAVTPYIYSLVKFDSAGNYTIDHQIFPTYSIYEDGQLVNVDHQHPLEDFIKLNSNSQIKAGDIH